MEAPKKPIVIAAVAFGVLATVGLLFLKRSSPPPPTPVVEAPPPEPAPPEPPPPQRKKLELPPLEQSDEFLREHIKTLSSNASLAEWLKAEDLARRIAAALEVMGGGKIPRDSLGFMAPKKKFATVKSGGKVFLDPKSYARYDAAGAAAESVDAQAAARLFMDLKPLLDQACQELGRRTCDVRETLLKDIKSLLEVPQVEGMIPLRMKIVTWEMTDEKLERLSPPQKLLLRMGPKNSAKVQGKLRELAMAVGASEGMLPKPQPYSPGLR